MPDVPKKSKAQVVRDYISEHPKAGVWKVAEALSKQGIDIDSRYVSEVKTREFKRLELKYGKDHPCMLNAAAKIELGKEHMQTISITHTTTSEPRPDPGDGWAVDGFVRTADGDPIAGVTVAAYDRRVRWYEEFGYDCTKEDGHFMIVVEKLPDKLPRHVYMRASKGKKLLPSNELRLAPAPKSADRVEIIISDAGSKGDCKPPPAPPSSRPSVLATWPSVPRSRPNQPSRPPSKRMQPYSKRSSPTTMFWRHGGRWPAMTLVPPKLPDLIIESLTHSPETPTTADTITFTAAVKNIGGGKAGRSTLALKVGGETVPKTYPVPALEPGQRYRVQRRSALSVAQRYRNTAMADFKNQVRESNETNNQKTDDYRLIPKPPPRFSAPRQLSPANGTVFNHFPRRTTLKWTAVPGATSYTVETAFKSRDTWSSPRQIPNIQTTTYTFNFVGAQPGRWRVWAVGPDGQESSKTGWWEFRYTR